MNRIMYRFEGEQMMTYWFAQGFTPDNGPYPR